MPWYTDSQIISIPVFSGLTPDQIPQVAADAGALYDYINANPGVADSDLRTWAEGAGIGPDRFNLASQALQQTGKGVEFAAGPLTPPPGPTSGPTPTLASLDAGASVPTEKLTADELKKVTRRMKLDVAKSATKSELAEAISRA